MIDKDKEVQRMYGYTDKDIKAVLEACVECLEKRGWRVDIGNQMLGGDIIISRYQKL